MEIILTNVSKLYGNGIDGVQGNLIFGVVEIELVRCDTGRNTRTMGTQYGVIVVRKCYTGCPNTRICTVANQRDYVFHDV